MAPLSPERNGDGTKHKSSLRKKNGMYTTVRAAAIPALPMCRPSCSSQLWHRAYKASCIRLLCSASTMRPMCPWQAARHYAHVSLEVGMLLAAVYVLR